MVRTPGAQTLGDEVYEQLRAAVLGGRYQPGQRLIPAELVAEYDVSPGILREALTRLAGQQLATIEPNRGYRVMSISTKQIEELVELRRINECQALRLAIQRGEADWESEILAAHHRLIAAGTTPETDPTGRGTVHHDFHMALIAACDNERLLTLCEELFRAAELYRRWASQELGKASARYVRDQANEHTEIVEAVLARKTDAAVALLEHHLGRTADLALEYAQSLDQGEADAAVIRRPSRSA